MRSRCRPNPIPLAAGSTKNSRSFAVSASSFTQKVLCSRATDAGRITLSNTRWIVTENGERDEAAIPSADDLRALLTTRFDVEVDARAADALFR